ncbi:MAG: FG-GAP-like repeat-containing protein [bacterium]
MNFANIVSNENRFFTPDLVDIDGDGDLDLFCGSLSGSLIYWENTGGPANPVWGNRVDNYGGITAGMYPRPVFCDTDNDGDKDIFIGDINGIVQCFMNTGNFQNPVFVQQAGSNVDTGASDAVFPEFVDIDGDSDFDLFIGKRSGTVLLYRNIGSAVTANWSLESDQYESINLGYSFLQPKFSDIDGDSDKDFFITDLSGHFYLYENTGTANTPAWNQVTDAFTRIFDFGQSSAPAVGDIDGDGDMDVLVGAESVTILKNIGTTQIPAWDWPGEKAVTIGGSWLIPELADIDGDGDLDLFVGTNNGELNYYTNMGTPASPDWSYITNHYEGIQYGGNSHVSVSFADIDNDNDLDMFVQHYTTNDILEFYQNTGTTNLAQWTLMDNNYLDLGSRGISFGMCDFGDLDQDGDLDCLLGNNNGKFYYFENIGNKDTPAWNYVGQIAGGIGVEGGTHYALPCFVDLNNDLYLDIISGLDGGGLNFWWNNTGGTGTLEDDAVTPEQFVLSQNYPNPFNPFTKIQYEITRKGIITLDVYDIIGRRIVTLVNEEKLPGVYEIVFDGSRFPSGLYHYKLRANDTVLDRKMLLIK